MVMESTEEILGFNRETLNCLNIFFRVNTMKIITPIQLLLVVDSWYS